MRIRRGSNKTMIHQIVNRILNRLCMIAPGGFSLRPQLQRFRGVKIGKKVWISQFVFIDELHPEGIRIGDYVTIGIRTSLIAHLYYGPRREQNGFRKIIIENNVFIGPHCLILPGVKIGAGSVIKGGSVVSKNIPPNTLWGARDAGPIAKVTMPLTPEHSYHEFIKGIRPIRKNRKENSTFLN